METVLKRPSHWKLIWAIVRKEVVSVAKHPAYRISLLLPLLMLLVFTLIFSELEQSSTLSVVVYDPDGSALVEQLAQQPGVEITAVASAAEVETAAAEDMVGGIVVPPGFDTAVARGQTPQLQLFLNDAARDSSLQRLQRLVTEIVWPMRYDAQPAEFQWTELNSDADTLLVTIPQYLFITILLLCLTLISVELLPQIIVEEKEGDAMTALLASPVGVGDVLIAKLLTAVLYTLLVLSLVIILRAGWQGNWGLTAVTLVSGLFLTMGIGLVMGARLQKRNQCSAVGAVLILLLNLPVWFAVINLSQLPPWTAFIIRLIPTHYLVNGLSTAINGGEATAVLLLQLALVALSGVVLMAVVWRQVKKGNWVMG